MIWRSGVSARQHVPHRLVGTRPATHSSVCCETRQAAHMWTEQNPAPRLAGRSSNNCSCPVAPEDGRAGVMLGNTPAEHYQSQSIVQCKYKRRIMEYSHRARSGRHAVDCSPVTVTSQDTATAPSHILLHLLYCTCTSACPPLCYIHCQVSLRSTM